MPVTSSCSWLSALSPALVVLGWIVVNWQNNRRETRKEIRSGLEAIYKALDEIEAAAIQFHTSSEWDEVQAQSLTIRINRAVQRIHILAHTLRTDLRSECARFRQSITLNNFDKTNHKGVAVHDPIVQEIGEYRDRLFLKLEKAFYERFLYRNLLR